MRAALVRVPRGALTMNETSELVLGDKPLSESEILATIDLFSEEELLGRETPPKRIKEAEISLGKWHIYFIHPENCKTCEPIMGPDRSLWDLYYVHIPFTIHELPPDRWCQRFKLQINLSDIKATALDLIPKKVTVTEKETWQIAPQFNFMGIGLNGVMDYTICFENIKDVISAFGEGQPQFYWVYTAQKGHRISPGTRNVIILLEVPSGTKFVTGYIYYEADLTKNLFGLLPQRTAITDKYPMNWNLAEAKKIL